MSITSPEFDRLSDKLDKLTALLSDHQSRTVERMARQEEKAATLASQLTDLIRRVDEVHRELVTKHDHERLALEVSDLDRRVKTMEDAATESKGRRSIMMALTGVGGGVIGALVKVLMDKLF
jgi:chromosome segregation ATPase